MNDFSTPGRTADAFASAFGRTAWVLTLAACFLAEATAQPTALSPASPPPSPTSAASAASAASTASAASAASPASAASARAAAVAAPAPGGGRSTTLAPVVVTGNPLGSREISAPVSVLSGDELVLRRGSSLGETLNGQPGVSSTYFGPNANRPTIRGFDGDRVRILENAVGSIDASSLSFDHAVPIDPLVIERVEVLRGPGALLYGGTAIGGVVNAIDNRVPKYALTGVSGAAEVRLGGADRERGGGARVEAGNGSFAIHADAFGRRTSDLVVPEHEPVEADGTVLARTDRIRNSAARSHGGALGGSWTFASGYLGIAADDYDSRYGIVAEPDVTIHMKRQHLSLAGEVRDLSGPWRAVRLRVDDTRYRHEEVEGTGEIGTTFRTKGPQARLEVEHAPLGPLRGVIGIQAERFDFSALGEEAFVPTTQTRRGGVFVVEELASRFGTSSAGLRVERVRVRSDGDADPDGEAQFGPAATRRFTLRSGSIGHVLPLAAEWSLSANASLSERAPTAFELHANGVHAATGAYERGDPTLRTERGRNLDLALQWKAGTSSARVGVFAARFSRYVSLEATGDDVADGEETVPEFAYRAVKARFRGVEAEGRHRLVESGWTLDLSGKLDYTRATNRSTGEPLPRIAPLRTTLGVDLGSGPWLGRLEVERASRQKRVPELDRETAGYTLVNLALTQRFDLFGQDAFWFVKGTNLLDKLAYSASTVETIRGLAPLPGRAVRAGVRVEF